MPTAAKEDEVMIQLFTYYPRNSDGLPSYKVGPEPVRIGQAVEVIDDGHGKGLVVPARPGGDRRGIRGVFHLIGEPDVIGHPGTMGLVISQIGAEFTLANDEGDDHPYGSGTPVRMLAPDCLHDLAVGAHLVPGGGTEELGYWAVAAPGEEPWLRVTDADPEVPFAEVLFVVGP